REASARAAPSPPPRHPLARAPPAGEGTDSPDAPDAGLVRQRCRDEKESGQQRIQPSAHPALHAHPSLMVLEIWVLPHTRTAPHPPSAFTGKGPPRAPPS